jgi:hypothetical protein
MPKPEGADTGRAGKHPVCAELELRGWEAELGHGRAGQITARHRASGVGVEVRVNTIWHDTATVWPLADRERFEETSGPHAGQELVCGLRDREALRRPHSTLADGDERVFLVRGSVTAAS